MTDYSGPSYDLDRVVSEEDLVLDNYTTVEAGATIRDIIKDMSGIGYGGHFGETSDDEDALFTYIARTPNEYNWLHATRLAYALACADAVMKVEVPEVGRPPIFGGTLVTSWSDHEWIRQNEGDERIVKCAGCGYPYYSPRGASDRCYGCWYSGFMQEAEDRYRDVIEAVESVQGIRSVEMTQTGGMCLALEVRVDDRRRFLLTDREDVLSFERDEEQGWMLGFYDYGPDDDNYDVIPLAGEDYPSADRKTAEAAKVLVEKALEAIEEGRAGAPA